METIKSYTDLEQSKKLAEILPLESADMYYREWKRMTEYIRIAHVGSADEKDLPCWSLTALLSVLPDEITDNGDVYRNMFFHLKGKYIIQYPRLTTLWPALLSVEADNPIDACVDMIAKLKENNFI